MKDILAETETKIAIARENWISMSFYLTYMKCSRVVVHIRYCYKATACTKAVTVVMTTSMIVSEQKTHLVFGPAPPELSP